MFMRFELMDEMKTSYRNVGQKNTLRTFSVRLEGPLDEKDATIGEGLDLATSVVGRIVAVGFL